MALPLVDVRLVAKDELRNALVHQGRRSLSGIHSDLHLGLLQIPRCRIQNGMFLFPHSSFSNIRFCSRLSGDLRLSTHLDVSIALPNQTSQLQKKNVMRDSTYIADPVERDRRKELKKKDAGGDTEVLQAAQVFVRSCVFADSNNFPRSIRIGCVHELITVSGVVCSFSFIPKKKKKKMLTEVKVEEDYEMVPIPRPKSQTR